MELREKKKSRSISAQDHYTLLQIEYLNYYCRLKTYKREVDVNKFLDICRMKREGIEYMSRKNCLPNIFKNEERLIKYIDKFLNEWGMPNFNYRDDYQKKVKGHWDKIYFFLNQPVTVRLSDKVTEKGIVSYVGTDSNTLTISMDDGKKKYQHKTNINNVRRDLDVSFFENLP